MLAEGIRAAIVEIAARPDFASLLQNGKKQPASPLKRGLNALQRLAIAIVGLVALQFFAGMSNILLGTPVWLQLTHLTLADLLWLSLVFFGASALETEPVAV